jgi:hypothetical protein
MKNKKINPFANRKLPLPGLFLAFLIIAGLTLPSCLKKDDFDFDKLAGFEYSPNGAAPLIHSKLSLGDVLSVYDVNHLFVENDFLWLIYNSTVFSVRADEVINIPDQPVNTVWGIPGPVPVSTPFLFSYSSSYNFVSSNSERFDWIELKSGYINYSISADFNHDAQILVTIPGATKNGLPFSKTIPYDYQGSVPVIVNDTFNLNGYTLVFGSGNQLVIDYQISGPGDANSDNSPYTVSLNESIDSLKFHKIVGYLGQHSITVNQDSVFLDLFKNAIYDSIHFEDPRLKIFTYNSYGMPMSLSVDLLKAESSSNGIVNVTGSGVPSAGSPWTFSYPSFADLLSGQFISADSFQLDQVNSTIKDAINISPQWVSYHVNTTSNLNGNPVTDTNFVVDTSRFSVDAEVVLPMWGWANGFILQDTLDFSFGDDVDILEWVLFKINTDNGFPIDAEMQLYFVDSAYTPLGSLLLSPQNVIEAGYVDPTPPNHNITPTHTLTQARIEKDQIMNFKNVDKLLIYAKLQTTNGDQTHVKIYSNCYLDVRIGMQAQIKTNVYPSND